MGYLNNNILLMFPIKRFKVNVFEIPYSLGYGQFRKRSTSLSRPWRRNPDFNTGTQGCHRDAHTHCDIYKQ